MFKQQLRRSHGTHRHLSCPIEGDRGHWISPKTPLKTIAAPGLCLASRLAGSFVASTSPDPCCNLGLAQSRVEVDDATRFTLVCKRGDSTTTSHLHSSSDKCEPTRRKPQQAPSKHQEPNQVAVLEDHSSSGRGWQIQMSHGRNGLFPSMEQGDIGACSGFYVQI